MPTVLYVDHLRSHADVRELERVFRRHGAVKMVRVFKTPDMLSRYGSFGIIQMGSHDEATAAIAALDGAVECSTVLGVRWASTREQAVSGQSRVFGSMNVTDASDA